MAPKKSGGPKAKAKAKEKGPTEEELKAEAEKKKQEELKADAEAKWEMFAEEGGERMKLKGFAEAFRAENQKKIKDGEKPWADTEEGPFIKEQFKPFAGKRELSKEEFMAWWPTLKELVEAKVQERAAAEEKKQEEKVAKEAEKAAKYAGDGVWDVPLNDLIEAVNKAYEKDKTPLIIDNTGDSPTRVDAFFQFSGGWIIECKKMIMDKAKGADVKEILEEERTKFFGAHCFKYGSTVVFRLANTACDIKNTFNSPEFPSLALLNAAEVRKCLGNDNADNFKGSPFDTMCPNDSERGELMCGINDKFRVVAVTQFTVEDYAGFLEPMFPLGLCQPMRVFQP